MVGKWHQCVGCMKNLSSYHSLWRHKKTCKGAGNHTGSGLLYHTNNASWSRANHIGKTSGDLVRDSKTLDPSEMESGSTGDEDCVDDVIDASSTTESNGEESSDDSNSDEDGVDDDNFDVWKEFVELSIGRKRSTVFDTLRCFIHVYYLLPEDDSYRVIVQDVEKACEKMDYFSALEHAIDKNKELVIHEVENANDCRDCFDIWCFLFHMAEEDCGSCLDVDLKFLMTVLHYMSLDDTIESIVATVKQILDEGDLKSLSDAVHLALEKHAKDILEKVREAEKKISERIIPNDSSGSGMYLNPWRYK